MERKTQKQIEEEADRIIKAYDEVYFDFMNRILDRVRAENNITQLGHLAVETPDPIFHDPTIGDKPCETGE